MTDERKMIKISYLYRNLRNNYGFAASFGYIHELKMIMKKFMNILWIIGPVLAILGAAIALYKMMCNPDGTSVYKVLPYENDPAKRNMHHIKHSGEEYHMQGYYTFASYICDEGYAKEENVNNFEYDVISAIADNENVFFWHRNPDRKGFCLNGFINHYPDFIIRMKSGRTILVETKGDHLVNDDSLNKIKIGNRWAAMAGNNYKYFMVFENKQVEGAITVKQLLQYLNEL